MYFGTHPEFQPRQLLFGAGDAELLLLRLWMAKGILWWPNARSFLFSSASRESSSLVREASFTGWLSRWFYDKECSDCLSKATDLLPTRCQGRQGGRVVSPSCNFRSVATATVTTTTTTAVAAFAFSSLFSNSSSSKSPQTKPQNLSFLSSLSLSLVSPNRFPLVKNFTNPPSALHMDAPTSNHQDDQVLPELLTEYMVDMKCEGCVNTVKNKLQTVNGIKNVEVDLSNQVVTILGCSFVKIMTEALEQTGRKARLIGQGVPE
ncbi:hypothetical protein Q3G72_014981 [Acer saccharum]|nr:hypothetical protein Q3G72_014981 [Acer saccharum]